jgi:hypothetical protein
MEAHSIWSTYCGVEHPATDVCEDGNIDSQRNTKREGNVKEFADVGGRVVKRRKLLGPNSVDGDLSS